MAMSLGFHQKNVKVDAYSLTQAEEGKRAWWLCHIMDKYYNTHPVIVEDRRVDEPSRTFCAVFGYPSVTDSNTKIFNADEPMPFQSAVEDDIIFGANEFNAVQFFREIITLSNNRDNALRNKPGALSLEALSSILQETLPVSLRPQNQLMLHNLSLRSSISALAHYNAVQVLSFQLSPLRSLPSLTLASARTSLRIVLETRSNGTTMCLWMWLYYAFTATVVLFVNAISHPRHDDVVLDLTLLEELNELCEGFKDSEGSQRVTAVCGRMVEVGWRVVKGAARKRSAQGDQEAESEGGKGSKLPRTSDGLGDERAESSVDVSGPLLFGDTLGDIETAGAMLETAPQAFEWDQWVEWLEETPLQ
jgi:hypothetical protein